MWIKCIYLRAYNKLINLLKLLSIQFLFYKLKYTKISNQKVLIYIFYEVYIYELEKELKELDKEIIVDEENSKDDDTDIDDSLNDTDTDNDNAEIEDVDE